MSTHPGAMKLAADFSSGFTSSTVSPNETSTVAPVEALIPEQIIAWLLYSQVYHMSDPPTATSLRLRNLLKRDPASDISLGSRACSR
jgi:hypothetical protein